MAISFVGASAVVTGNNPTVAVPAGVAADDLLLIVISSNSTAATPAGWTLLSSQGAGQFISIVYKYAGTTNASQQVTSPSIASKAVMLAYRGTGAFQVVPAYTTGTGTTATPNTLTTTYANDYVVSIYASAAQATVTNWTPNGSTTSRVNSPNSSLSKGLLIADELQAAAGVSTARAATLSASNTWASVAIALVEQRTLYWIGNAGTWNTTFTANWSDVSGGSAASLPPSIADNVIFDTLSGTGTVTCTGAVCKDLTVTATQAIIIGGNSNTLSIHGSLSMVSGGSAAFSGSSSNVFTFASPATGRTIDTAGKIIGRIIIAGVGGAWTVLSDIETTTVGTVSFTLSAGAIDFGNFNLTCSGISSNTSNVRGLTFGSSIITCNNNGAASSGFNINSTNLTFSAGTSSLNITSASSANFGGLTWYDVTFSGSSISGANTFHNLTLNYGGTGVSSCSLGADQTITNAFSCTTGSIISRPQIQSSVAGVTRTITVNGPTVTLSNTDFQGIVAAGTYGTWSGTSLGDLGGNTNITFDAPKTVYWNLTGNRSWSSAGWAASSGGTPNINNFPLAQDTAVFNDAGSVTGTINIDNPWSVGSVDTSARTSAMTFVSAGNNWYVRYSGVTLSPAVTITNSSVIRFVAYTGTQTFTQNGANLSSSVGILVETAQALGATFVLGGPTNNTFGSVTVTSGIFNTNNFDLACTTFSSSNSNTRTITLGTSTVNLTSTGTVWDTNTATGLTFSGASSTINLTNTTTSARTFSSGSGLTYGTLNIGGATGISTTTITLGTYATLSSTKTVAHTITISQPCTINNWTVTGTAGNVVTVNSSTVGTLRSITYSGSQINLDYMSFTDIFFNYTLNASNPYKVYAGANSTNGGNNSGIAFMDGTIKKAYRLTTGTTWTVPADWNSSNNNIYLIGAGGGGANSAVSGGNRAAGGGGGGGGYTAITNYTATPSSTVLYTIGASIGNAKGGDTGFGQSTISFVGSTTLAETTNTPAHVMNVPSGTADGDLMVLFITTSTAPIYTIPAGWTVASLNSTTGLVLYRTASSEPASYTVTTSTSNIGTGYIATYRNATWDINGSFSASANPSVASSVTVSSNDSIVLDYVFTKVGSITYTTPTGFSSVASESNANSPSSALFSRLFNPGATGTVSTTPSSGTAQSILVVIRPTPFFAAGGGQPGLATSTSSTGGAGGTGAFAGGTGGVGAVSPTNNTGCGAGGGGGAGGPNGNGGNGGNGFGSLTGASVAGGGGGGNGGGSAGGNASSGLSGAGGNNFAGIGGAAASTGSGVAGTLGGGGSGGAGVATNGGSGGSGIDIQNTVGGGGGGGSNGSSASTPATNNGLYGGGGTGSSVTTTNISGTGSAGSQGVIFIVYSFGAAPVSNGNFFFMFG
jgi:hypothetical protein